MGMDGLAGVRDGRAREGYIRGVGTHHDYSREARKAGEVMEFEDGKILDLERSILYRRNQSTGDPAARTLGLASLGISCTVSKFVLRVKSR